jgi:hypothetical protein
MYKALKVVELQCYQGYIIQDLLKPELSIGLQQVSFYMSMSSACTIASFHRPCQEQKIMSA